MKGWREDPLEEYQRYRRQAHRQYVTSTAVTWMILIAAAITITVGAWLVIGVILAVAG